MTKNFGRVPFLIYSKLILQRHVLQRTVILCYFANSQTFNFAKIGETMLGLQRLEGLAFIWPGVTVEPYLLRYYCSSGLGSVIIFVLSRESESILHHPLKTCISSTMSSLFILLKYSTVREDLVPIFNMKHIHRFCDVAFCYLCRDLMHGPIDPHRNCAQTSLVCE